jgi:hypothetical protein
MAMWEATCNSYSDRLYVKGEVIECDETQLPSKHFKLIEDEDVIAEKVNDSGLGDKVPIGLATMPLEELRKLAAERGIKLHHMAGREKHITAILEQEEGKYHQEPETTPVTEQ